MANGIYGTNIPALIKNSDISKYVDIYYTFSKTRNSTDVNANKIQKLDAENLRNVILDTDDADKTVEGLYNLSLPSNIFGKKGYYTIYIKPKEIPVTITDVSILKDFTNVRGIILDINSLSDDIKSDASTNNALVGYRLIYKNADGTRDTETRIVTSNNKCEPVSQVSTTSSSKSYTYQYNENASLTFLTVTPSMPLSFKASATPFIGKASQDVYLVNTFFEPVCIELEMVKHDADSVAELMTATQLRDLNNGVITSFDSNNNIIAQHELSTLKETETGSPQYEIRENKSSNIDFTQTITDKLG